MYYNYFTDLPFQGACYKSRQHLSKIQLSQDENLPLISTEEKQQTFFTLEVPLNVFLYMFYSLHKGQAYRSLKDWTDKRPSQVVEIALNLQETLSHKSGHCSEFKCFVVG